MLRPISLRIVWGIKTSMATRRALSGVVSGFDSTWLLKTPIRSSTSQILSSSSSQEPRAVTNFSTSSPASSATTPPTQAMQEPDQTPPIHILGLGNLGKFFAHSLATLPSPPPITVLTHRPGLPYAFAQSGSTIALLTNGSTPSLAHGIAIEPIQGGPSTPIAHLIVATKATATASALAALKPRLRPTSTILFTQNGLGAVDEVTTLVFPDPATRPTYLAAIVVHGIFSTSPFSCTHAGQADMKLGYVSSTASPPPSRYLLDHVLASPQLAAQEVSPAELAHAQLEKLVANAAINPLTALFRVRNGGLLIPAVAPLRRALLREASAVVLAHLSRAAAAAAGGAALDDAVAARFSAAGLERAVLRVSARTAANRSSMLQDVEAGRETEVRYINGWIVGRGEELGVEVGTHRAVVRLVGEGRVVGVGEIAAYFPELREFAGK